MTKEDLTEKEYSSLLSRILRVISQYGLKATTMDMVAAELQMSKRTLYEIFGSKNEMVDEVLDYIFESAKSKHQKAFTESDNIIEALWKIYRTSIEFMSGMSVDFFRDLDKICELKHKYADRNEKREHDMLEMFAAGVEQGVLRADVNYEIQAKLLYVQMESLKRMEELFPPEITLAMAYETIFSSFIRAIASTEGLKILDHLEKRTDAGDRNCPADIKD